MAFLEVKNLTRIYGKKENQLTALDHVSFSVEKANLKNDSAVEYAVSNIDRTADVSTVYEFDGKIKPYKDRLKYKNGNARKGKKYRLRIKSLNHNLQISGRWNS